MNCLKYAWLSSMEYRLSDAKSMKFVVALSAQSPETAPIASGPCADAPAKAFAQTSLIIVNLFPVNRLDSGCTVPPGALSNQRQGNLPALQAMLPFAPISRLQLARPGSLGGAFSGMQTALLTDG